MSIKISACMITKNEGDHIRKCMESIKDTVDEIIVVDGFSIDDTVSICKEYDAKIIQQKFSGSMAEERNVSLSAAKNEWALIIDGDESISEELRNYLKNFVPDDKYTGYSFARRNYYDKYCKRWTKQSYYPDHQLRLFKSSCRYQRNTHELTSALDGLIKEEPIEIYINHYVPGRYSYSEFVNHWIPTSIKLQARWKEECSKPKIYYILILPFVFFFHFFIMFFVRKYYLDGLAGIRVSIMMSMYFFMIKFYVIFDKYKIHD